jgi:hypothetical protein
MITTLIVGILFVKDVRVELDASSKDSNGKWTEAFKFDYCNHCAAMDM